MTTSRNNTIMSWMAYTDFLSRLRIAAGILLPLNTRTLLLYPGGRDCIGAAGVDAYGEKAEHVRIGHIEKGLRLLLRSQVFLNAQPMCAFKRSRFCFISDT